MKVVNTRAALGRTRRDHRRAKCLAAAIAAVPLLSLPAFGTATAAEPEVFDALRPGARVLTLSWGFPISLIARSPDDDLRGEVCEDGRTCKPVSYPWLDRNLGVALLDHSLNAEEAPDQQIVFGYSQGARVASGWLRRHAGTADAPTSDELSLVLIGNPGRKYGGGHVEWGQPTPATDYSVLDVSRQYDLGSDVPDNRFNLLAMANALAGFGSVHMDYADIDIYDPANYVWTEGNTTYVFVPAERLPILDPLYLLGLTELADALDAPLRAAIEEGYDRSYLPAEPGLPPAEAEPELDGPSAEPGQAAAAAVASPRSRSAIALDQDGAANLLADNADSPVESEPGLMDVDVAGADVVDVDVADVDVAGADVDGIDGIDGTSQHGDPEDEALEGTALEDNALEDNALEDNALDSLAEEDQGAATTATDDSDSPQLSVDDAASSSDSDISSGSQSSPGDESSPDGDE